ncbi:MAG: hypothetical protein H7Y62_07370 [Hyphomicrobium sp.]|nr:hypothetical protein [Hyphomicrobium sp.]
MRLLPVAVAMLACVALAHAEALTVDFAGQRYTLNFEDRAQQEDGSPGDGLAEFTLPGETVNDWSKLFAFHAYPEMGDDPVAAVKMVGKVVKETNKDANFAIIENEKTGEALIDFLTWAPESDVMEFNVFKYARATDGKGLVAVQFAQHIKLGDIDVDGMRALRARSVQDMADTPISEAQAYFARKQGKSALQVGEDAEPDFARAGGDN